MNDDPITASSAARQPTHDTGDQDAADNGEGSSQERNAARSSSRVRRAKVGITKKLEFMGHLMSSLDMVVFAELALLYYMDCSFARLIIRALTQYMYLTPKPEELVKLLPAPRPQIYAIFVTNMICMLLHMFTALPAANEAMRGYLHGGIIIDFVGQKAPTSKLSLLLLDLLVLALQCVMSAVWLEKDRLVKIDVTLRRGKATPTLTTDGTVSAQEMGVSTSAATTGQDLDAEERGFLRDDPLDNVDEANNIELRPLMTEPNEIFDERRGNLELRYERILNFLGGSTREGDSPGLLDVLMSGNAMLANFHVVHAIRTLGTDSQNPAAYPLRLTGYTATIAALAAQSGQGRLESRTR